MNDLAAPRKQTQEGHARGHSSRKKQTQTLPLVVLAILIIAGLWYFFRTPLPAPAPALAENVTPLVTGVQALDLVSIDYVLTLADGTVVDTNNATLAQVYNLSTYVKGPFRFVIGQSGKLTGFDTAIIGIELGQTVTRLIPASEPVLVLTKDLTRRVVRNQPFPRFRELSEQKFIKAFNKKPIMGDIVINEDQPFSFKVTKVVNGTVRIEPNIQERQRMTLPGYEWESEMVYRSNTDIVFRHNPTPGQIITTEFGPARVDPEPGILNITYLVRMDQELTYYTPAQGIGSNPHQFRVTGLTDKNFTITRIKYLPQENLFLTARILEWTPGVKKSRSKNV